MKTVIYLCGFYSLIFAVFHMGFWKMFKWAEELKKLDIVNKAVMEVLNIQIIFIFLFISTICFVFPNELRSTKMGHIVLLGCSLFWLIRIVNQFIFFEINVGTYVLTAIFVIGVVIFALPVFRSCGG
ncbi:MAG: hypothetical protein FWE63_05280 [Bacteroidales bacterium]|nr:hypothetical protein [Bacteroidales bacterium]